MHCSKASAETNTIGTARAIDHASKSSRPSSSSPSSSRRGARRRRSTTQTAARCSARSTRAGRDARAPDSLAPAPAAADTPESVRRFERTLSEDRPGRADLARSTILLASSRHSLRLLDQRRLEAQIGDRLELSRRHAENLAGDVARGLTPEKLTAHLYGDNVDRATRAEMSRLRKLLGSAWRSRRIASPPTWRRTS